VNRASGEFAKVSADATRMGSQVNAAQGSMADGFKNAGAEASAMGTQVNTAQGTMTNSFKNAGTEASKMASQVNAAQGTMADGFKNAGTEASAMGSRVKAAQVDMANSFKNAGAEASVMGSQVNAASTTVSTSMQKAMVDVDAFNARIRTLSTAIIGIGATGTAIGHIAHQFGLLNDEQTRIFTSAMMVVTVMGTLMRTSTGLAIAQKVYSAACWVATAAQNALNISYGTFLALTGVGIAVIVAAAAAMWSFAHSMNSATASVKNFNEAAEETPSRTRSIQRYGETQTASPRTRPKADEAALYRRGVE
jgi:hypothetical protein